jgi:hypothetical protein
MARRGGPRLLRLAIGRLILTIMELSTSEPQRSSAVTEAMEAESCSDMPASLGWKASCRSGRTSTKNIVTDDSNCAPRMTTFVTDRSQASAARISFHLREQFDGTGIASSSKRSHATGGIDCYSA